MFVDFNILNQLGSPSINSNTFANRPAAGQTGRLFVSTDTFEIYRDNGTTWDLIGGPGSSTITGTGTATQVAYFTSSQAIGSSANLFWDNTSGFLGVATATPTARIEAVKTDGVGIYANFTTNAGSGSSTTALWAKNVTNGSGFSAVIEETTPNTTAGQYPLLIKHSLSSGTAGVGMGTGIHWQLPDDAGTFKTTQLTIETTDAAAATYKTRYRFNVQNNGSSLPVAYINSTGLGIFTATPGTALDIHSTGTIAQLNSTSATGNTYIAFQRTGTGVWRMGDNYSAGNNFFELHNTALATDALQVAAATNKTSWQATQTYTTGLARGNYFDYNLSVSAGGSFSSPNAITALGASLDLTLAGSATIPSGARSGLDAYNSIGFTGTGTLTHNQGAQIRAYSNVTAGWAFNGSATGTITHLAGLRALFPDNTGSAITVTNNYALLLNNQTANTGTVTYTNRWGIYQEGASDLNYMASNLLLGSTVNNGDKLQVTGNASFSANITAANFYIPAGSAGTVGLANVSAAIQFYSGSASPANTILFYNNGVNTARLDSSGNFGLGVTPSAWDAANTKALQLDGGSFYMYGGDRVFLGQNIFFGSGGDTYVKSAPATTYRQYNGQHAWFNAASGTAGNAITFTQAMTLTSGGYLLLGTGTSAYGQAGRGTFEMNGSAENIFAQKVNNSLANYIYSDNTKTEFYSTNFLQISVNGLERARITAGGNFLIGTTTDTGYKLNVNGLAFSTSFKSTGGSFDPTSGNAWVNAAFATLTNASPYGGGIALIDGTAGFCTWLDGSGANFRIGSATTSTNPTSQFLLTSAGNVAVAGSIQTGTPSGGTTGAWKLGSYKAAAVVVSTTNYIEVDIGGTLYKLAVVT